MRELKKMTIKCRLNTTIKWVMLLLTTAWLLLVLTDLSESAEITYKVPNPFSKLDQNTANGYYYIKAIQEHNTHKKLIQEYFSLGLGLTYSVHTDLSRKSEPWAILVDGNEGLTYILNSLNALDEQSLDCKLDHVHNTGNNKEHFPWSYSYDADQIIDGDRAANKRVPTRLASVYGIGGIWLNLIRADVRSSLVGPSSPNTRSNSWRLTTDDRQVEMLFEKSQKWSDCYETAQASLDETKPIEINISSGVGKTKASINDTNGSPPVVVERIAIKGFSYGPQGDDGDYPIQRLRYQLELCKKATTKWHRRFPNLMRALEDSSKRLYKIDYVTHRYSKYGMEAELNGKFNQEHHRFMYPYELTSEVFSLAHDTQTIIYEPGFMERQPGIGKDGKLVSKREDLFMIRRRNEKNTMMPAGSASSSAASAIVDFYHMSYYDENTGVSCIKGEREPRPKFRLFRRPLVPLKQQLADGLVKAELEDDQQHYYINGLGALLMNAARMRHNSFSLVSFKIKVPNSETNLEERHTIRVDVLQVLDEQDKVRVLFYFERRGTTTTNLKRSSSSWDLAEGDRNELTRLVRIDVRKAPEGTNGRAPEIDQALIDNEEDLIVQYHIFDFEFELQEHEADVYLELPDECIHNVPVVVSDEQQTKSSSLDEEDEDLATSIDREAQNKNESASNVDYEYDLEHDHETDQDTDWWWADEYRMERSHSSDRLMPRFRSELNHGNNYKIVTRLEVLGTSNDGEGNSEPTSKAIWISESVDLDAERARIKVYSSRENLRKDEADESLMIFYESELILRLSKDRRCSRLDDISELSNNWLRLLSGRFNYCATLMASTENGSGGHNDPSSSKDDELIVVESNRLSSYGLGAMWRLVESSDRVEFLGTKHERLELDGIKYEQEVWRYDDGDVSMFWTFIVQDFANYGRRINAKLRLYSVLISYGPRKNQKASSSSGNFKQVKAIVEHFDGGEFRDWLGIPIACEDVAQAERTFDHVDKAIKAPGPQQVIGGGPSGVYELDYTVSKMTLRDSSSGGGLADSFKEAGDMRVRESFDRRWNRAKLVIEERNLAKKTELFVDGQSKRIFLFNEQLDKCTSLTKLRPTLESILATRFIEDNPNFDANQMGYGLLSTWQMLSTKGAKLRVKQFVDKTGYSSEDHLYSIELVKPLSSMGPPSAEEERSEARMYMKKWRPGDLSKNFHNYNHTRGAPRRWSHDLRLERIELRRLRDRMQHHHSDRDSDHLRIIIHEQRGRLSEEWKLPQACQELSPLESKRLGATASNEPADSVTTSVKVAAEFPKLSKLFQGSQKFHMRSEISIQGDMDTLHLVDELYSGGNVRIRTHGVGKMAERDCDLVMFEDTYNQFDLSVPLSCDRLFEDKVNLCLHMSLFDVWLGRMARIQTLASLHYGPLSMWKLAEKGTASAISTELIKTVELPSAMWTELGGQSMIETFKQQLEREMNRETWLITSKKSGHGSEWSYRMQFAKKQKLVAHEDGQQGVNELHELESIIVQDTTGDGRPLEVYIDVVNYNHQPEENEFDALFRLPEGWNCRRTLIQDKEKPFELDLNSKANLQLDYEASLELFKGQSDKESLNKEFYNSDILHGPVRNDVGLGGTATKQLLPTLVGTYMTGDNLVVDSTNKVRANRTGPKGLDLSVHESVTRFADGQSLNRRLIADRDRALEYELDLMTGACSINTVQDVNWRLSFPLEANSKIHKHTISLFPESQLFDRDLFRLMFVENFDKNGRRLFFRVNKYVTVGEDNKRVVHASYERELDLLRLSNELVGPARIIRKYERVLDEGDTGQLAKNSSSDRRVNFMTAQVYLLSENKQQLQAILTMQLQVYPFDSLSDFLDLASVSDCFNEAEPLAQRRLASFTLEYPIPKQFINTQAIRESSIYKLKDNFYRILIRPRGGVKLMPLQLDGRAHLEFVQQDRLLRIHFNVLEAPSAMVYFSRRPECTMDDRIETIAELRLLPNVEACSRWCDQTNCIAMSYCQDDRQCRVASETGTRRLFSKSTNDKERPSKKELQQTILDSLASACTPRPVCTYLYNKAVTPRRPPTLSNLRDYLDRVVNKKTNKKQLEALGLSLGSVEVDFFLLDTGLVEPTRFYESSEMFRWQHEDYEDPFQIESNLGIAAGDSSSSFLGPPEETSSGYQPEVGSFAVWKEKSRFNVEALNKLNNDPKDSIDSSGFVIRSAPNLSQSRCLQECQRNNCLLVSTCKLERRCETITVTGAKSPIMSLGPLKRELVISNSSECSIFIRDHLDMFQLFENTRRQAKYWQKLDDYTAQECAAACQLNGPTECLAFDMCTILDETNATQAQPQSTRSICLLQRIHSVTQESFDKFSSLMPSSLDTDFGGSDSTDQSNITTNGGLQVTDCCDHYSRSVLAEFRRLPNAKLKKPHGSGVLRGISADRCAVNCLQNSACQAFEYCRRPSQQPTQSCYLIQFATDDDRQNWLIHFNRQSANISIANTTEPTDTASKEHTGQIVKSTACSIYVAKSATLIQSEPIGGQSLSINDAIAGSHFSGQRILVIAVSLLIATTLGAVIQLVYIRWTGRSIQFRRLTWLTQ